MNKTKLLSFLVIVLVILNITLLAVFVLKKPHHPPHHLGPKNIIIERLNFDENQQKQFNNLIKEHRAKIESTDSKIRTSKNKLYSLLKEDNNKESAELINTINSLQKEIENLHYQHFLDIKELCKDEQLQDFNDLTNDLAKLFSPHPKPKR